MPQFAHLLTKSYFTRIHGYYKLHNFFLAGAWKIITRAAEHANTAIKKLGKFKRLLEIEKKCGNVIKLVTPTRELIKEGDLKKISKADSEHQTRHVYLVSNTMRQFAIIKINLWWNLTIYVHTLL